MVMISISLLLVSCNFSNEEDDTKRPVPILKGNEIEMSFDVAKENMNTDIDIFMDTSVSMRGYLFVENSEFSATLSGIDVATKSIANKSKNKEVNYFEFGSEVREIEDFDDLKDWENYDFTSSSIDHAINKLDFKNLSVIITDLAVKTESMDLLINKLSSDVISKGYSIGLIGAKSKYEGYVYSLEKENDKIVVLNSDKGPSKYFPFYMLVIGEQDLITKFYEDLEYYTLSDLAKGTYNYTLIPLVSKGILDNVKAEEFTFDLLNEESAMFQESEDIVNEESYPYQYKIRHASENDIGFKVSGINYNLIKHIPKVKSVVYEEVDVYQYDQEADTWNAIDKSEDLVDIRMNSSDGDVEYDIVVKSNLIEDKGVYAINSKLYYGQSKETNQSIFEIPDWINQWSTNKSKIKPWKEEFEAFSKVYGVPKTNEVASKYKRWLKKNEMKSVVDMNSTIDLNKLVKKICYFVDHEEDVKIHDFTIYIRKE